MLRAYQTEALDAVRQAYKRGVHRAIVSLPTGCGKTTLFPALPQTMAFGQNDVMLVLAHRSELIDQAAKRLKADQPEWRIGREKAEVRAHPKSNVVVASVQSLHATRLQELLHRFSQRIALLVIDECHHAIAEGYVRIMDAVAEARTDALIVGVTATTPRQDGAALGRVFEEVVYHRDMLWAINDGWLVGPRCFRLAGTADLGGVPIVNGDFAIGDLAKKLNSEQRNRLIVETYQRHLAGKKTIVFCTTVEHARRLNDAFVSAGIASAWGSGDMPAARRQQMLRNFAQGRIRVLINCMLWVEGFDEPTVETIINSRPTRSRSLYIQIVGRGTRPHPSVAGILGQCATAAARQATIASSAKPELLVVDIVDDNAHDLVTLPSIIGRPPREIVDMDTSLNFRRPCASDGYDAIAEDLSVLPTPTESALPPPGPETIELALDGASGVDESSGRLSFSTDLESVQRFQTGAARDVDESKLRWVAYDTDMYELYLPERWRAGDRDVDTAFRAALRTADGRGRERFAAAVASLSLDATQLQIFRERLIIRRFDHEFNVSIVQNDVERELGQVEQLHEAFTRAERWLANNRGDIRSALLASASWREKVTTPAQRRLLERDLGVVPADVPSNRGDASHLITKLLDQRRRLETPSAIA